MFRVCKQCGQTTYGQGVCHLCGYTTGRPNLRVRAYIQKVVRMEKMKRNAVISGARRKVAW
jgi:hypothetical protein